MNNDFQNKLFQFETPPPTGVWERIADALESSDGYAHRLAMFEAEPPATAWRTIDSTLNEAATPAKVVPFLIRYKNPLRYVAAASLIAFVLVTVTLTMRRTAAGSLADNKKIPAPSQSVQQKAKTSTNPGSDESVSLAAVLAPNEVKEKGIMASVKRTLAYIRPQNILPRLALSKRFIPHRATEESVADFSAQDAFMVYSDDNGNAMRLPKKLFALVNCGDGDGSCQERIQNLRQKLSANVASSDFTGMLDLVRELQ